MIFAVLGPLWAKLLLLIFDAFAWVIESVAKIAAEHKTELLAVVVAALCLVFAGSNFERAAIVLLAAISYILGFKHF